MPSLIRLDEFKGEKPARDPRLYFKNASRSNGRFTFSIEEEYPHIVHLHCDVFETEHYYSGSEWATNSFFVDLRRWTERVAQGDIIFDYKNMGHQWCWNWNEEDAKHSWKRKYSDIRHGYWYIYFESENDLGMFALMHGEKMSTPQKYHPEYEEVIMKNEELHCDRYY